MRIFNPPPTYQGLVQLAGQALGVTNPTYPNPCTKGNILVCYQQASAQTVTVSDTLSNSWNSVGWAGSGGGNMNMWWALCKSTGANTVTGSGSTSSVVALEFAGVNAIDAFGSVTTTGSAVTQTTATITTAHANEIIIAMYNNGNGGYSLTGASGIATVCMVVSNPAIYFSAVSAIQTGQTASCTIPSHAGQQLNNIIATFYLSSSPNSLNFGD